MFVALNIAQRYADGIFQRLAGILSKPRAWVEPRDFLGAQYAVLHAEQKRGTPDWDEIDWLAADYSRWVLLPDDIRLPQNSILKPWDSCQFDRQVLLRTACELVARTRMPMYRRVLGLIDEDGSHVDLLHELLKHYTSVRVVTRSTARYQFASEEMMRELGAPVVVGNSLTSLADCVLVLCPSDFSSEEDVRLPCPVLAGQSCNLRYRHEQLTHLQVGLPALSTLPPENISAHRFAGALYELCELQQIDLTAHSLLYNGRISSLDEAARAVAAMAGIPYSGNAIDHF